MAEFEAARLRRQDDGERDFALAWHVEAFHRQKVLKPLHSLLTRVRRSNAPPTIAHQRSVLEILSAQYGIPLRRERQS